MPKLSANELKRLREKKRDEINNPKEPIQIIVHMGTCGIASGAKKIYDAVMNEIKSHNIKDVSVKTTGCAGFCSREPMATIIMNDKPPIKYVDLDEKKVSEIFSEHIVNGNIVKKHALAIGYETVC